MTTQAFRDWHRCDGMLPDITVPATIIEKLMQSLDPAGDCPWLTTLAADGTRQTLSRAQLAQRAGRIGAWLTSAHRIQPGDIVVLLPRKDLPSVTAIFRILWTGA